MEANQTSFKVLMFPWLAHGHVAPYFELSKRLSKRNFHIYFCSTPVILDSIKNNDPSIQLVEFHLPNLPELPPKYHTIKNAPLHLVPTLRQAFQMSSSKFSDIISKIKPDLVIYDVHQPWAAKLASSQGIPAVHFNILGATSISLFHHLHTYRNDSTFPYPAIYFRDFEKRDLFRQGESIKATLRDEDEDEGLYFGTFKLSSDIVLLHIFSGIEDKYTSYLSDLCGRKIVSVGPLIADHTEEEEESSDSEILQWLSQRNQYSTLYIAFGSENYSSKERMKEIAKGLELSNVNFIWSIRFPDGSGISMEDALPEGFLDRVKDRGIVVEGWVPQAKILAHKSIGGFMSHCGWNSVLESIYFAVPIVGLPIRMEQPLNCRLMVEIGVGLEVPVDDESGKFEGEEVAKAINKVIMEESGEGFRKKARELSEKMKMEEEEAIKQVAEELSNICMKK